MSGTVGIEPVPTVLSSLTVTNILLAEGGTTIIVVPGSQPLVLNANTGVPPTANAGTLLEIVGADTTTPIVAGYSYGSSFSYEGFRSDGTQANPTAVQINEALLNLTGSGYDGTDFGAAVPGDITILSAENFSTGAHGTYTRFRVTAPGTVTKAEVARLQSTGLLMAANHYVAESTATGLVAAGTNQGTALALTSQINNLTTVTASTGVVLPSVASVNIGTILIIFNGGASPVQVYGNGSNTIDGVAGSTGVPLTNAKRCMYVAISATAWISAQLGVVSA